jgi:nucleoside-diphosphate-sugar epimerase
MSQKDRIMSTLNSQPLHVIFGTGPLGKAVMRVLVKQGRRVRMVNRSGKAEVPAGVEVVAGDAYNIDSTRAVTRGAAVVYQCAQPAFHDWVTKFVPLQACIVEGTAANGARLVVAENLYMYGDPDGQIIREDMPYRAHTRKGKVRAQMSEALLSAHKAGKLRVTIARGSDFFGPGVLESAYGERAFYPALEGKPASLVGNIDLPHTATYISDFGRAMVMLGECDEALGQAWHVPNPETVAQREFMTMFFEELGLPPKMSSMGRVMTQIGGLFVPAAREMVEMMYEFEKPFVVDSSKFVARFGNIATPLREAIRETAAWYKAHPHQGK